jgi:hypothetical protein
MGDWTDEAWNSLAGGTNFLLGEVTFFGSAASIYGAGEGRKLPGGDVAGCNIFVKRDDIKGRPTAGNRGGAGKPRHFKK